MQLMPRIYAKATTVLVWLGNYDADAARGVQWLHDRYAKRKSMTELLEHVPHWHALRYIVNNKYWTRLWIVQEIFMARQLEVYTGSLRWDFSDLRKISQEPDPAYFTMDWSKWKSIVEAKDMWRKKRKLDLHEAVFRWSDQDCGVTHDKVYGLLGLVSKPERIKIDLSISMLELLEEVLRLEKKKVYAKEYQYALKFTATLLVSLKIEHVESAKRIKTEFLKGYKE